MSAKSRLGSGGYGICRKGTFAGKTLDTGEVHTGKVVDLFLSTQVSAAIRKPGIPGGTPAWLKTTLEILTGRRGNRVEMPKFQALTFSDAPTRAECEALYRYINAVRYSLEQIIKRLDS
jgi:hypothetical protein